MQVKAESGLGLRSREFSKFHNSEENVEHDVGEHRNDQYGEGSLRYTLPLKPIRDQSCDQVAYNSYRGGNDAKTCPWHTQSPFGWSSSREKLDSPSHGERDQDGNEEFPSSEKDEVV